jgi:hypothetical protein
MNRREAKREAQRAQSNREELLKRMARVLPEDGRLEALDGLTLGRLSKPMESVHALYRPAFCLIAQGSKRVLLGEKAYRYDPGHYLIFTGDLPIVFRVEGADGEHPYLGLTLNLDPDLVASVMMEAEAVMRRGDADVKAIGVNPVGADLLDAVVRLVRLLDEPGDRRSSPRSSSGRSSTVCWPQERERASGTSWHLRGEIPAASPGLSGTCAITTRSR